jgi:hypothetical protein
MVCIIQRARADLLSVQQGFAVASRRAHRTQKEDFYQVIERNAEPEHDVLLTNPPYSADHIEAILQYARKVSSALSSR